MTLIKTGAQCGTCFALSSACVKIGMAYLHAWALFSAPIAFCTAGTLTGCGLYFQTKGFKDGNSIVVVCVAGNVSQMCVAAVYGLLILGEPLPETFFALCGWVTSWAFILYGVVALSGAESGAALARGPPELQRAPRSRAAGPRTSGCLTPARPPGARQSSRTAPPRVAAAVHGCAGVRGSAAVHGPFWRIQKRV